MIDRDLAALLFSGGLAVSGRGGLELFSAPLTED